MIFEGIRRWRWYMFALYPALLACSYLVRYLPGEPEVSADQETVLVRSASSADRDLATVRIAFQQFEPRKESHTIPVLLLHGSPGRGDDFDRLAPLLDSERRLIAPDLPGFGDSTHSVSDYSIKAHANYTLQLLDALRLDRVHVVGFSMGGGVALELAHLAPQRIASLTLLSSIGVQELELLGDYSLNHVIHGLQLGALWLLLDFTPHFGLFDGTGLTVAYARNFYDTDQRPLRAYLRAYAGPMLVIHGKHDVLVPVEAALEHHRLVPQSELQITDENHFMVFMNPEPLAPVLNQFFDRVESDRAVVRAKADPVRAVEADAPFDPARVPKVTGLAAVITFLLLAAATLVSEDLACITAGLMVSQGRIGFVLATIACFLGIFIGDVLLFVTGRLFGRAAVRTIPLKWFIKQEDIEQASKRFARRGATVILASRFVPGMRLPTYFAAGVLNTSFLWFSFYFLVACLIWTPLLVAISMFVGGELLKSVLLDNQNLLIRFLIAALITLVLLKLLVRIASKRGRRLLLSRWIRLRHWEFWPAWLFYPPVVLYIIWLGFKHGSLTLFTLANPAIPGGGFIGESKAEILGQLRNAGKKVARSKLIPARIESSDRVAMALDFVASEGLAFPVVLKPDVGQRGAGVKIVKSCDDLTEHLAHAQLDLLVQEYIDGEEFGVFYYRYPEENRGRILSITDKRFPTVVGDGRKTLEELILEDQRTISMASFFLKQERKRLEWVPIKGERVQLVELGTHCRGAVFLDGTALSTAHLEERIDEVSRCFDGFYFGRYDVRCKSSESLSDGNDFRVIELNGVTSEATSIYDPGKSLSDAYRMLARQWRIAFEIGAENRARGMKPSSVGSLVGALLSFKRHSKLLT